MASFEPFAASFQTYAKTKLDQVESDMIHQVRSEDDINFLEEQLSHTVNETKNDFNARIDQLQSDIKSRRPNQNDPDFNNKSKQYATFLGNALTGMDKLRSCLGQIFQRLKGIVMSVVNWIKESISTAINFIRDGFRSLKNLFF